MAETIYVTKAERLLMQLIKEHPDIFANGQVNWNNMRDYAILVCVNHNMAQPDKTHAVQRACDANGVNKTHFYKANIAQKRFI